MDGEPEPALSSGFKQKVLDRLGIDHGTAIQIRRSFWSGRIGKSLLLTAACLPLFFAGYFSLRYMQPEVTKYIRKGKMGYPQYEHFLREKKHYKQEKTFTRKVDKAVRNYFKQVRLPSLEIKTDIFTDTYRIISKKHIGKGSPYIIKKRSHIVIDVSGQRRYLAFSKKWDLFRYLKQRFPDHYHNIIFKPETIVTIKYNSNLLTALIILAILIRLLLLADIFRRRKRWWYYLSALLLGTLFLPIYYFLRKKQ